MGGVNEQHCEHCRHWRSVGARRRCGECRRYPPVARGYGVGVWPTTESGAWCGEWAGLARLDAQPGGPIHPPGPQARELLAWSAERAAVPAPVSPADAVAAKRAAATAYTRAYRAKAKAAHDG